MPNPLPLLSRRTYHKDSYMAHRRDWKTGFEGRYRRTNSPARQDHVPTNHTNSNNNNSSSSSSNNASRTAPQPLDNDNAINNNNGESPLATKGFAISSPVGRQRVCSDDWSSALLYKALLPRLCSLLICGLMTDLCVIDKLSAIFFLYHFSLLI